jgi:hypothetical protein
MALAQNMQVVMSSIWHANSEARLQGGQMFGRRLTVLVVENSLVELQKYVGFVKSLGHEAIGVSTVSKDVFIQ